MTNEQAIRILESMKSEMLLSFDHDRKEALKLAISALEKQIPKRPKYKAEDRFVKNHFTEYSYCPVCEKEVVAGDMFCVMCGQAIDWTEGEG